MNRLPQHPGLPMRPISYDETQVSTYLLPKSVPLYKPAILVLEIFALLLTRENTANKVTSSTLMPLSANLLSLLRQVQSVAVRRSTVTSGFTKVFALLLKWDVSTSMRCQWTRQPSCRLV